MVGDSRDGGGRPPINLVSTRFGKQGYCPLLGPLILRREVVPPGSFGFSRGEVNHDYSTIRETERAEQGPPNSHLGGGHHAEVRATRNGCVKPAE